MNTELPQKLDIEVMPSWWETGTLIEDSVRVDGQTWYGVCASVISAQYVLRGWTTRPRILFRRDGTLIDGQRAELTGA